MSEDSRTGPRVVVFGSINADVFARVRRHPAPGETVLGSGGQVRPGGKGANQAVAAALAGAARVAMIGAVGQDAYASIALARLRETCDVRGVRKSNEPTGTALITVADGGENSIIVIPGANAGVGLAELELLDGLGHEDVLILQGEIPASVSADAARHAAQRGARVLLNLAPVAAFPADVLRLANPLIVNEHEAVGGLTILGGGHNAGGSPEELVRGLLERGVPSVILTLGEAGVMVADPDITHLHACNVQALDTTGAGDAFVGSCAAMLISGESLLDAAREANLFAAESVTRQGAQDSYPDWRR